MNKLKKRTEEYGNQLHTKVAQLEEEKQREALKMQEQLSNNLHELDAKLRRKSDHLKYFHTHIMKTLKLKGDQ